MQMIKLHNTAVLLCYTQRGDDKLTHPKPVRNYYPKSEGPTQRGKATTMQHTGTILVIGDDTPITELIIEVLTDEGYIALSMGDTTELLAAITYHTPALILLDMGMPGELVKHMHQVKLMPPPIVLMTTAPRTVVPLLVPGSIECLVEPFDLNDLLTCVARYVQPADQLLQIELAT
jgi:two-component system, response regulator, stage 0 sporulation protein F